MKDEEKKLYDKRSRRKVGRDVSVGDKNLIQQVVIILSNDYEDLNLIKTIPSNGRESIKLMKIPSNGWEILELTKTNP